MKSLELYNTIGNVPYVTTFSGMKQACLHSARALTKKMEYYAPTLFCKFQDLGVPRLRKRLVFGNPSSQAFQLLESQQRLKSPSGLLLLQRKNFTGGSKRSLNCTQEDFGLTGGRIRKLGLASAPMLEHADWAEFIPQGVAFSARNCASLHWGDGGICYSIFAGIQKVHQQEMNVRCTRVLTFQERH